ncbi:hypothetical protein WJ42_02100 [Burkholderia cepacia]|nr:hypothetical protein WJ42_02100 [Burkholderia cepacia]KWC63880.1 hypothetical protein WL55_25400 [Burkholderia cepacia]
MHDAVAQCGFRGGIDRQDRCARNDQSSPRLAWCPLHWPRSVIALWRLPAFRICGPTQYSGQPSNGTSS